MGVATKEKNTVHPEDNSKVLFSMPDIVADDGGKNVVKIPGKKPSIYEKLVFFLDILIPTVKSEDEIIEIPDESYVQKVIYGKFKKVRVLKEPTAGVPEVLVEKRETETYRVMDAVDKSWFAPIDLTSPFIRKWDNTTLLLLVFTACVTPFETA
jgi:hypothetical protein